MGSRLTRGSKASASKERHRANLAVFFVFLMSSSFFDVILLFSLGDLPFAASLESEECKIGWDSNGAAGYRTTVFNELAMAFALLRGGLA